MEKPNVVVIGYGFAGRCFHAYLVGLASGLNLYGIATSRPEARDQIERDLGVKTFRHFDDVLADPAVDLVVLATPNDLHAPHAVQALAAGKHVVTDKPMCLSIAEARPDDRGQPSARPLAQRVSEPPLGRRFPRRERRAGPRAARRSLFAGDVLGSIRPLRAVGAASRGTAAANSSI